MSGYYSPTAPTHCPACGQEKRGNAIVCRDCWLALPAGLRFALPSKPGEERNRIAALCVEYATIASQQRARIDASMDRLRNKYVRDTFDRKTRAGRDRQVAILVEVHPAQ